MKTANEDGWNLAGTATATITADRTLSISEKLGQATSGAYEIDPLYDPRWAALVESDPRASVFHSPKWLRALQVVYGYRPVVVTTCLPGIPLTNGVVFCDIKSWLTGQRFVSLPFSDHCDLLIDGLDELDDVLLHLRRYVNEEKWKYIEIRPVSWEPSSRTKLGKSLTYHLHRLDLRRNTQELFRKFHKDCVQRKIRRAERENLQYEEGTSDDLLQKFYRLLVMTRRRQSLPPQPLSWFRGLIAAFGKDLKIRVASKDGVAVASILTLSHKKTMVYKYGCSDAAANKFGGMAFLFWKTIQEAKNLGIREFDLGRSAPDDPGLIAFKGHLGAVCLPLSYYRYPAPAPKAEASGAASAWVRQALACLPHPVFTGAGRLLYRHLG